MGEANRLNIRVTKPGGDNSTVRGTPITMDTVTKWINRQEIEPEAKKLMLKRVSRYPEGALGRFLKNAPKHLADARAIARKREEDRPLEPLEDENKD